MHRLLEQSLNAFSLAMLGTVLALVLFLFPPVGIVCSMTPPVRLPWSTAAQILPPEEMRDLEIRLSRDGRVFFGPNVVPTRQVAAAMREVANRGTLGRQVMVRADATVPYQSVENVIRSAHSAGFERVVLVTFEGSLVEAWRNGLPSNSPLQPTSTASPSS